MGEVASLGAALARVPGDALLAAAFVTYCGPLTPEGRLMLVHRLSALSPFARAPSRP